jgi:hypothetical protein
LGPIVKLKTPKVTELENTLENFNHRNFKPLLFSTREERKQKHWETTITEFQTSSNSTKEERQHSGKL